MSSFKTMTESEKDSEITTNNIRPEFNALMELENRTKHSFRFKTFSLISSIKNLKNKLNVCF